MNRAYGVPAADVGSEELARDFYAIGMQGAVAGARFVGGTTSGAPTAGTFRIGDYVIDQSGKVQVCTVAGSPGTWVAAGSGLSDPTTTKGDLIVHGASTTRLGVGSDTQVLTADSTQTLGVKWAAVAAATVPSMASSVGTNAGAITVAGDGSFHLLSGLTNGPAAVTMAAATNDVITVDFLCTATSAGTNGTNFVTCRITSGTPVNIGALSGWDPPVASKDALISITGVHTIAAADLTSGNVTVDVYWQANTNATTILNTSAINSVLRVINWKH